MRRGPDYDQSIQPFDHGPYGARGITIPLELVEDFEDYDYVTWTDNKDGSYTIVPRTI